MTVIYAFLLLFTIWLCFVSYYLYSINKLFVSLTRVKKDNLGQVLRTILSNQDATKKEFSEIFSEIARIDKEKGSFIQRVGFVRYKPFGKSDLDNSFTIALLDIHGTGIVINAVQMSDKSRVYAKEVSRGQGKMDLSHEEKLAIFRAMKV